VVSFQLSFATNEESIDHFIEKVKWFQKIKKRPRGRLTYFFLIGVSTNVIPR
jgi:hypothetical protein